MTPSPARLEWAAPAKNRGGQKFTKSKLQLSALAATRKARNHSEEDGGCKGSDGKARARPDEFLCAPEQPREGARGCSGESPARGERPPSARALHAVARLSRPPRSERSGCLLNHRPLGAAACAQATNAKCTEKSPELEESKAARGAALEGNGAASHSRSQSALAGENAHTQAAEARLPVRQLSPMRAVCGKARGCAKLLTRASAGKQGQARPAFWGVLVASGRLPGPRRQKPRPRDWATRQWLWAADGAW